MFFLDYITKVLSWRTVIDILFVAFLFYQIIAMLKGTRAAQVLIGMVVIFIAYLLSSVLQLETLHWIISKFYSSFIIVVIVLFQDDIRRLLSRFGRGPFVSGLDNLSGTHIIDEVINAVKTLSHERIGALIVFERSTGLDRLHEHSIPLDSLVSEQLLGSIFQSFSPLHDGAVIIQKGRITSASAQLPLSKNPLFSKKMGTRHSAAVGMSEETDAVVLVVSEETGGISIAWEGNLQRQTSIEATRKMLRVLLIPRGDRSGFLHWMEDNIFYPYNKMMLKFREKSTTQKTVPPEFDRRQNQERRFRPRDVSLHESLEFQQIEQENINASQTSKNAYIRFPRSSTIPSLASQFAYITGQEAANSSLLLTIQKDPILNDPPFSHGIDHAPHASEKNVALKALADLAPEDRFDPPIPVVTPPHGISIGGIPLTPHEDPVAAPSAKDNKGSSK